MSFRYAQIDEQGNVLGVSNLAGEVVNDNMIAITDSFNTTNKKYVNGEWVEYMPPEVEEVLEVTDQELFQAEILLSQAEIIQKQTFIEEVLAQLLINQMGV